MSIADTEGSVVVNMTSPKTAQVSKFIPCRYSTALIQSFQKEIVFPAEQ